MSTESDNSSCEDEDAFPVEADTLTMHDVGVLSDPNDDDASIATLQRLVSSRVGDTMPVPPTREAASLPLGNESDHALGEGVADRLGL